MLAAEDPERSLEQRAVVRLIEPARRAAGMRQRDQDPLAVALHRPDHVTERNLADKSLDRELTHEENDPRADKGDLSVEPRAMAPEEGSLAIDFTRPYVEQKAELVARWLLDRSAVHILASDAHDTRRRIPNLSAGRTVAEKIVGAEYADALVEGNPGAIVKGIPIPFCPRPVLD